MKKNRIKVEQMSTKDLQRALINSSGTQKANIQKELAKRLK